MEIFIISTRLMVIGMGVTFAFLIIMVYVMGLLEKAVAALDKYFPQEQQKTADAGHGPARGKAKIALALAAAKHNSR